jgi:1,4-dihydroxy-2-naphthoate octaprenyltransferase
VSLAPGFLTANLLFLNEFPDVEADKKGGRNNLVITLGYKMAGRLYAAFMAMTYLSIIAGVVLKLMPPASLIGLATIPFAFKAISIAFKHYDNVQKMIPALKANVMTVLGTNALVAVGYFLSGSQ